MESTTEVTGFIFAGLGLFFIGVRLIGVNLRGMAGRSFREFISKVTKKTWLSALMGIVAGAITQSTSAITFIMTGMMSAGLITLQGALPIVLWSNVGNCVLVFLAVLNFHIMVLYLIGIVGFLHYLNLDRSKKFKPFIGLALGVVLLFYGLDLMKSGAVPLKEYQAVKSFILFSENNWLLGLIIAGTISIMAQSAATVAAITIALANTGILSFEGALILVYGSNLGPAFSTWLLAKRMDGAAKQLTSFQVLFKLFGLFVVMILYFLEFRGGIPLVGAALAKVTPQIHYQLAIAYLLYQLVGAVGLSIISQPAAVWLEKRYPESDEDLLGKPKYVHEDALNDLHTALLLVEKEELRILGRFPMYFDWIREEANKVYHPSILRIGSHSLLTYLEEYLQGMLSKDIDQTIIEGVLAAQKRIELLINLEDCIHDVAQLAINEKVSKVMTSWESNIIESMHMLILSLNDWVKERDPDDKAFLLKITEDRGDLMKKIHRQIRRTHPNIGAQDQKVFELLASRFERFVWMIRYMARLVPEKEPVSS